MRRGFASTVLFTLTLLLVPIAASAEFLDITVNDTAIPVVVGDPNPTTTGSFTVDKLNGAYAEKFTFDGAGGFTARAYADFTQYLSNEGSTSVNTGLGSTYKIYAVFTSSGWTSTAPTVSFGGNDYYSLTATSATVDLYIDVSMDTTKALGASGSDDVVLTNTADDHKIMYASQLESATGLIGGPAGFFDWVFRDPTLTSLGELYWTDLPLFGQFHSNIDGDFDTGPGTPSGTHTVTGDISNVFVPVPEPATLTLLGLGLAGAGAMARRRRAGRAAE